MSHDQSITKPELSQAAGLEVSPLVGGSPDSVHEESVPSVAGRRTGVPRRGRQTVSPEQAGGQPQLTPQQRLLVLDTWMKSGLPAGDYAPLVGRRLPNAIWSLKRPRNIPRWHSAVSARGASFKAR